MFFLRLDPPLLRSTHIERYFQPRPVPLPLLPAHFPPFPTNVGVASATQAAAAAVASTIGEVARGSSRTSGAVSGITGIQKAISESGIVIRRPLRGKGNRSYSSWARFGFRAMNSLFRLWRIAATMCLLVNICSVVTCRIWFNASPHKAAQYTNAARFECGAIVSMKLACYDCPLNGFNGWIGQIHCLAAGVLTFFVTFLN